jgi:hypothetical protein
MPGETSAACGSSHAYIDHALTLAAQKLLPAECAGLLLRSNLQKLQCKVLLFVLFVCCMSVLCVCVVCLY